ncbi:DNA-3-methyladenine glycosylase I [bacterium]|nr:DNA-3-methyladenine glycosylase I [bacterium]|tara:strand:- start:14474 stop:15058 length:585 start_codon:yes stop_codon:yes gene_type:complete
MKKRCAWPGNNELMLAYHDTEWGTPQTDDNILFEYLLLDSFQAGLSWQIMINKRENFRSAFDDFDAKKISKYSTVKKRSLLNDPGIVRNRLKIEAAVSNAKGFLELQKEFGSFSNYLWSFVDYQPIQNKWKTLKQIPTKTPLSDTISRDLKKRGFNFVGSTIIYAFMQGCGMVNDHTTDCFRYKQVAKKRVKKT